jgi:uncharacterized protein with PIN domain
MTIVIDASALVAIVFAEPGHPKRFSTSSPMRKVF